MTEIETVEHAVAHRTGQSRPSPEIATPLVYGMLDRQYRAVLDERVPMLGGITPRAASGTKAGREKIAAWLKHLENMSGR